MAHGRILSKDICQDKKVHELSSDLCRLAFSWAITHLDRDGRMPGDPGVVKSWVFPRCEDVTTAQMASFIEEWHDKKLVLWYEVDGDHYLLFPKFRKHQPNLPYNKEAESRIPPPPEEILRDFCSGLAPDLLQLKRREEKRREENSGGAGAPPDKEPAVKRLIDRYFNHYVQKAGQKPTVTGQWGRNLKILLRAHTEETVQRVMDYFFDYPKRTQWGWNRFMGAFDNLLPGAMGRKPAASPGGQGWPCPHCGHQNNQTGSTCFRCHKDRDEIPGGKKPNDP